MSIFKKAIKRDAKLRLALCGPAGSGKTFTLLKLATGLAGTIAYVDTEHGSASKYAHTDICGNGGVCADPSHFYFDVIEPASFDPRELVSFIDEAVKSGYGAICIDSLSHYWMGPGGELELVDNKAKTERGNSFAAWKTVTPYHTALVDRMISAPIHVLVAMRTKTEWVVEKDDKGKSVPRKIGTAPIMRDGIEFEFDVCGELDQDNNLAITKSRCSALQGKVINRPGMEMASTLAEWLTGAALEPVPVKASNGHSDAIPGPLVGILSSLNRPGATTDALKLLKAQLIEAKPETGAEEYVIILEKCGVKPKGNTTAVIQLAIIQLWKTAQEARDAALKPIATDADLPPVTQSLAKAQTGTFEDGWITEDEPHATTK